MTSPALRRSLRLRILVVLVAPAFVWLASELSRIGQGPFGVPLDPGTVASSVADLGLRCAGAAGDVLDRPFPEADRAIPEDLRERLEGLGVWQDTSSDWLEWYGTPLSPPDELLDATGPSWTLRRTGAVTRLIAVAGPDAVGRRATATFRLSGADRTERLESLLPAVRGTAWRVDLDVDRRSSDESSARIELPGGRAATITVRPGPARNPGGGLAVATFAALSALLFPWGRWTRDASGAGGAILAIVAVRLGLLVTGPPTPPIPAELVDARWYGTDVWLGLFASPADLVLSGLAAWWITRTTCRYLEGERSGASPARFLATTVVAAAATGTLVAIAHSCAVDGQVRPSLVGGELPSGPGLALGLGVGTFLLAAAEPWGLGWTLRPTRRRPSPSRSAVWIAVVPLALIAGLALQRGQDRVTLDRLETEFAPQILERELRRRLALDATVRWASERVTQTFERTPTPEPAVLHNLVYDLWSSSPMAHAGLQSSLTLYDLSGDTVAHFGFDIPVLDERPGVGPAVRDESFEILSTVRERMLHHEQTISLDGRPVATLIGHILDEPDNLGFLPVPRAYLACLGQVSDPVADARDATWSAPEYVEYSPVGVARIHTLGRPPGWAYPLDKAAIERRTLRIRSGDVPYFALPLVETDRLHLLLAPAPTWLDRLGSSARLALLAVALLVLSDGLPRVLRRGGVRLVVEGLRRSYLRKLVVALLLASVVPWVAMSLGLKANLERRGQAAREIAATQLAVVAQRVIEDYLDAFDDIPETELPDDALLYWLRRLVGQDIHLYEEGRLVASSKRELFDAGLAIPHLPSDVDFQVNRSNRPVLVRPERIGGVTMPVAYAPVRVRDASRNVIVAVPLVIHQPEIARAVDRNVEMLLLSTLAVAAIVAAIAVPMARAVARPVRDLARAAGRVATGDDQVRVRARGEDEVADLGRSFNSMVAALGRQRADLEQRRDYMEALLRHATTAVVSTDAAGRMITVNPAAVALLGEHGAHAELGRTVADAVASVPSLGPLAACLRASPRADEPEEVNLVREDGSAQRVRLVRVELPDPEGGPSGRLVLFDDVTDLMRRNQLEAWAEMARAIAHEIKNPLTPIQLSTEHLERVLTDRGVLPSSDIEACLETVGKQVRTLREIASEFSTYARVPALVRERTHLDAFLREVLLPYRTAPPDGVEILETHDPGLEVLIDRRVLGRAIVNLVENGLHAMPDGGTLTLASRSDHPGTVRISVADTGHGLSDDVRSRLFEPYFSTKSSGTGLGLAIVQRAVEGHGGHIEVESETGDGTTFHLILPTADVTTADDDV